MNCARPSILNYFSTSEYHMASPHLFSQPLTVAVLMLALGCSGQTSQTPTVMPAKYEIIDRTKYRVFNYTEGDASKLYVNTRDGETLQLLFLIENPDGVFPACVLYESQRYGAWGMIPSGAWQLGFTTSSREGQRPVFFPHAEPAESVILLFRTMREEKGQMRGEMGKLVFSPWKVQRLKSPGASIDLDLSDPNCDLARSNPELESSLNKITDWVEFNARYQYVPESLSDEP